jgi:hypothetical protein
MHCVEFERRLNDLLDNRLPLDSDLELSAHADECCECADLLAGHELLVHGMATLCGAGASQEFGLADDAWNRSSFDRRPAPAVPAELAVRVAAEVSAAGRRRLSFWWMLPALAASVLIAAAVYSGARPKSPPSSDNDVASSVALPATSLTADHWQAKWREFGDSRYQWMDQMADGLKPVTDSMSAALHALRRTWPGAEAGVRSSWLPAGRCEAEFVA